MLGYFEQGHPVLLSKSETPEQQLEGLNAANAGQTMQEKRTAKQSKSKRAKSKPEAPIDLKLVFGDPAPKDTASPSGVLAWIASAPEHLPVAKPIESKPPNVALSDGLLFGFSREPAAKERIVFIASECEKLLQVADRTGSEFSRSLDSMDNQLYLLRRGITTDPDALRALENAKSLREYASMLDEYPERDWAEGRATLRRVANAYADMPRTDKDRDARIRGHIFEACEWVLKMLSDAQRAQLCDSRISSLNTFTITSLVIDRVGCFLKSTEAKRLGANRAAVDHYIRACCTPTQLGGENPVNQALTDLFAAMGIPQTAKQFSANRRRAKNSMKRNSKSST